MKQTEFAPIPAGRFRMGAADGPHPEDGEGPPREIDLAGFSIARTTVSNAAFSAFVEASGYVTTAERQGFSAVFQGQLDNPERYPPVSQVAPWWRRVEGACWHRPDGKTAPESALPAVHISQDDARAYCRWIGARLPTEAQWERAAGSQTGIAPHIWRGEFPGGPEMLPGPKGVSDAKPNEFGLLHACGNVWEWTADRFTRLHSPRPDKNPKGPLNGSLYVVKGGSFLCCPSYCARFRPSSRRGELPGATTSHLGFRVAAGP